MIDVPGIFRASTPGVFEFFLNRRNDHKRTHKHLGLTTDEDIRIIDKMVKEYMRNKRTM